MNKETAFKNAKATIDFLADRGLTFQEANEAVLMAKAIFRGLQNAAVEKQKEAALADVTRTAEISLMQKDCTLDIRAMMMVEKREGYTPEQISNAERLIKILVGVPEDKRVLFTAIITAYIDGVETGARITKEIEGATV